MKLLKNAGTILLIALLYLAASVVANAVMPLGIGLDPVQAARVLSMLFLGALIYAALLTYILKRAGYRGFTLVALVSFAWYGLITFMTQIETWYFLGAFPELGVGELAKLFLHGLVTTAILIPLATLVAGKIKSGGDNPPVGLGNFLTRKPGTVLPLIVVSYVLLYLLAGYFIAWQFTAVRLHYSGSAEKLSFLGQMLNIIATDAPLIPFQVLRAMLWFFFGVPLFLLFRKRRVEGIVLSFLAFAILPTAQLLYPNPVMPYAVRMAHLLEVSTSTGVFGAFAAWLWFKYKVPGKDRC